MQQPYNLSNCNTNYSWGQQRSNQGHERSYWQEQQRNVVIHDIHGCSAFFWYASSICSKTLSFRAVIRGNEGQPVVSPLTSGLLRHIFFVMLSVFCFHLIWNMPIFLVMIFLRLKGQKRSLEVKSWSWEVLWSRTAKKCGVHDIHGCPAFLWYTSSICSKMLSFELSSEVN